MPALAATLALFSGCSKGPPRSTATDTSASEAEAARFENAHRAVCEAAGDAKQAEAIFFDRAHDALHELATVLGDTDRASAARLLDAKQDLEADREGAEPPGILRDDLVALAAVTRDALDGLGIEQAECER